MTDLVMLEAQKNAILANLKGWSQARLSFRPEPAAWSALQVVDHLVRTEEGVLVLAREGSRTPHRIGIRDRLGFRFIMFLFRTDRRVKTPASASQVLPTDEPVLDNVIARWQRTRLEFAAFQAGLSNRTASQGLFRHPVMGWMGLPQIIDFFSVHMVHHEFPLDRIRSA